MSWREVFQIRFRPSADLAAVAASWVLVTGSLATATFVITPQRGGGYFLAYAVVAALGFGVAFPTWWMVRHRKRGVADLGVTTRALGLSLLLQLVFSAVLCTQTLARADMPARRHARKREAVAERTGAIASSRFTR